MKGDFHYELRIKISHIAFTMCYLEWVVVKTELCQNGPIPILAQTDIDVLHCPAVGEANSSP